jgi:alpha-beta hydrolase superfamily lysophospholipase
MPEPAEPRKSSFWRRSVLIVIGVVVAVIALVTVALIVFVSSGQPDEPGDFYSAPSPLPAGPPGTVIRSEKFDDAPAGSSGWKILYLSTSYTGKPVAVSGLLFVPDTPAPEGGRNVVVFTHGTIGVASNCALSNLGSHAPPLIDGLAEFLRAGDAVVVPDYQGLGTAGPHPYLVGGSEARGALDAVRAAHLFDQADAGTRFAAWGASQGGQAALFTGQDAASYAPELSLAGVAVAAPATKLGALFEVNRDTTFGRVLSAYVLASWSRVYPRLHLDQVVTPVARPVVRQIARICLVGEGGLVGSAVTTQLLRISYLRAPPWETEPWKGVFALNTPGSRRTPAPLLIAQGEADRLVRPEVTAAFVEELCQRGDKVDYRTYPGVEHLDAGPATVAEVAQWIAGRFAGEPAATTCS